MGPSGSGKSTFIRTFNGLEPYQKGSIEIDGTLIAHNQKGIELLRREVGMVFQQFNLFPHLTVLKNITLGPIHLRGLSKSEAKAKAMELLEKVGIAFLKLMRYSSTNEQTNCEYLSRRLGYRPQRALNQELDRFLLQ
ncbi:MAG: ATP-binding cassette domain-containing protein [Pleurocapsa sp. MO_226.B13]|nr:ATP-binding cassette domain-containing protein [Pleurocapsa sp. MO_226.B13]